MSKNFGPETPSLDDQRYDEGLRQLQISAGHEIHMPCGCRLKATAPNMAEVFSFKPPLILHIASPDHVMSGDDVYECTVCHGLALSSDLGPMYYPPTRTVL
jgi:hypothetical protein